MWEEKEGRIENHFTKIGGGIRKQKKNKSSAARSDTVVVN